MRRATASVADVLAALSDDSVSSMLNADGSTLVNESYTAYGLPRNPTTWSGSASSVDLSVSAGVTRQGYTWQTALGNMGLNHMNGRVQDAITGVFLSPDPYITEPGNPQNYNRYSYVYNNPMSHTDPSGFSACSADLCDGFYFAGGTGSGLWGSNNGYSIDGGADVSVCYSYSCQKTQTGKSDYYWMQFDAYADKNTNQIVKVTSRLITYHYLPNSILPSSNRSILEQAVGTATTSSSSGGVEARNTSLVAQTQNPTGCSGSAPNGLWHSNSLYRNNSNPKATVTVDASQLTVKQTGPFNSRGTAPAHVTGWERIVYGSVTLRRDVSGVMSLLPDKYDFGMHPISAGDWQYEIPRNIETVLGYAVATFGGITDLFDLAAGKPMATPFTTKFSCSPNVVHEQ